VEALEAMAPTFRESPMRWYEPQYRLAVAIARSHAALARHDLDEAEARLADADVLARRLRRGHEVLTTKMLRAIVARERDADHALPLLAETLSLAYLSGNARLLAQAPPAARELADELRTTGSSGATLRLVPDSAPPAQQVEAARAARHATARHALLTSKESEILQLLQKGMSNKQIARILDVSGETVKWHLKNLFLKLSAGTRQHAVDRARLLGIVQ
jgi:LuxR family maltose regulon positive regulatory protein